MFPQYMIGQKVVTGFMALMVFFNISLFGSDIPDIKAKISSHKIKSGYVDFYGTITIDGEKMPMVVSVTGEEKTTNINKKEIIDKKEDINEKENINKKEDVSRNTNERKKEDKTINERKNINEDKNIREDKTIKEKRETVNRNINNQDNTSTTIKDDKTPGRMKIKIKTRHGDVVEIDDDLGSGERSDFERECKKEIINEVRDYLFEIKNEMRNNNTSLWRKVENTVNGFFGYVNETNKEKSKYRLPWFK